MGTRTRLGTESAADGMKQVKARRKRAIYADYMSRVHFGGEMLGAVLTGCG